MVADGANQYDWTSCRVDQDSLVRVVRIHAKRDFLANGRSNESEGCQAPWPIIRAAGMFRANAEDK
jgi:hypothetical protein